MLKVPLAGKSLGSTWSGMHCGMQCGSFMAVSIIIVFKWPNKNRSKAPPDIFSLQMKFTIVMIKKLVQQLPSAALAKKKTRNQIIGKNNNTSKQTA